MTIEKEREMLEHLRGIRGEPDEQWQEKLKERMGIAAWDQLKAAERDSETSLYGMFGAGLFRNKGEIQGLRAEIVAGLLRCLGSYSCDHARAGLRPLRAFLGARVITCEECAPSFLPVIMAQDQRVRDGGDFLCDFCLEEHEYFIPSALQAGPAIAMGDMCDDCYAQREEIE